MKNAWRKWLAGLLSMAMVLTMLPTTAMAASGLRTSNPEVGSSAAVYAPEDNEEGAPYNTISATEYNLSYGPLEISGDCAYIVRGDTMVNNIVVTGGSVELTLDGVNVENENCAFDIQGGNVTLILAGESVNLFNSGKGFAGIHVAENASLTIKGTGTLNATSNQIGSGSVPTAAGAGIGGNGVHENDQATRDNAGHITIESGTICAVSEGDGAGIGGGWTDGSNLPLTGSFQSITINGGTVTAISKSNGAGVGCGCWAQSMGELSITGGVIHARSDAPAGSACDIGYGHKGSEFNSSVNITGGVIYTEGTHGRGIAARSVVANNCILIDCSGNAEFKGNPQIADRFSVPAGKTFTVSQGNTITVAENGLLTIEENATLVVENEATLEVKGTVSNAGTILKHGTIRGTDASGKALGDYTLIVPTFESVEGDYSQPEARSVQVSNPGDMPITVSVTVQGDDYLWDPSADTTVKAGQKESMGMICPKVGISTGKHVAAISAVCSSEALGAVVLEAEISFLVTGGSVTYLDSSGALQTCSEAILVTGDTTVMESGWYVATGSVTVSERIQVNGDVHLILADGCSLEVQQGISVCKGNSLTVYCQSGRTGQLIATNPTHNDFLKNREGGGAAIGADRGKDAGDITINGGRITAHVEKLGGACIGMGGWSGAPGSVTINSGYLKLSIKTGDEGAFGDCEQHINGGVIEYEKPSGANDGNIHTDNICGIVLINNVGIVYGNATLEDNFEISGSKKLTVAGDATLTIAEGVTLTNNGSLKNESTIYNYGSIIDHGYLFDDGIIVGNPPQSDYRLTLQLPEFGILQEGYAQPDAQDIVLINVGMKQVYVQNMYVSGNSDGFVIERDEMVLAGSRYIQPGDSIILGTICPDDDLTAGQYQVTVRIDFWGNSSRSIEKTADFLVTTPPVPYLDEHGTEQMCATAIAITGDTQVLGDGWYVVRDASVLLSQRLKVEGNAHIILADDTVLKAQQGISVNEGSSLTIYCQAQRTGKLEAINPDGGGAAIGADQDSDAGDIIINGGNITATVQYEDGSCIGQGGSGSEAGSVTVNDGHLTLICSAGREDPLGDVYVIKGGIVEFRYSGNAYRYPWIDDDCVVGGIVIVDDKNWELYEGKVYGNVTLADSFTIPKGLSLAVPEDAVLTIPEGVTLTNNGTLENDGTIRNEGTVLDHYQLNDNGEIIGNQPVSDYRLTVEEVTFGKVLEGYAQLAPLPIVIHNLGINAATIESVETDASNFTIVNGNDVIEPGDTDTSWTVQPNANLGKGSYFTVITITYNDGRKAVAELIFKVVSQAEMKLSENGDGTE